MAELHRSRGRAIHHEGGVAGEGPGVQRAAVAQQPAVLLRSVGQNGQMGQRVEGQGVVQLPVDGPRGEREWAQVSLVQERLRTLVGVGVGAGEGLKSSGFWVGV